MTTENAYNARTPAWGNLEEFTPLIAQGIDILSSMLEGTSFDISRLVNAVKYDSGIRPMMEADYLKQSELLSGFRRSTGHDAQTRFESLVHTGVDYLWQGKGDAEYAVRKMAVLGGGFRAFGSGGATIADINGWNQELGSYNNALSQTMADYYNAPPDDNVSKGERVLLQSKLMGGDNTLIRQNAMARDIARRAMAEGFDVGLDDKDPDKWRNLNRSLEQKLEEQRAKIAKEYDNALIDIQNEFANGNISPEDVNRKATEIAKNRTSQEEEAEKTVKALKDLSGAIVESQDKLKEFSAAASDWGIVLKTDAATAVDRLSGMLGVNAARTFDPSDFGNMTRYMQHSAQLSGQSVEHVLGIAGAASKQLAAYGMTGDAAIAVGAYTALASTEGHSYRNTQQVSEAANMQMTAQMLNSGEGRYYTGGQQLFMMMHPELSSKDASKKWHELIMQAGRVDQNVISNILGRNVSHDELMRASKSNESMEQLASNPDRIADIHSMRIQHEANRTFNVMEQYDAQGNIVNVGEGIRRLSNLAGRNVFSIYSTMKRDEILKQYGEDVGGQLISFKQALDSGIFAARDRGDFGGIRANDVNVYYELMDPEAQQRIRNRSRQAQIRADMQRDYTSGGFFRVLSNEAANRPELTLGDMASMVKSMTFNVDTVDFLSTANVGKQDRRALASLFDPEGKAQYDTRLVSGIKAFDDLTHAGVTKENALKASGLNAFGFTIDDGGKLKFDIKAVDKEAVATDTEMDATLSKQYRDKKAALLKNLTGDNDTYENRVNAAKTLALYDVFQQKSRYDYNIYTDEQRKALNKAQDVLSDGNATAEQVAQAQAAIEVAFKDTRSGKIAEDKARGEFGTPLTGDALERIIFEGISRVIKKLSGGENDPIIVKQVGSE